MRRGQGRAPDPKGMTHPGPTPAQALRPPAQVMQLARLGQMQPSRLSFVRHLLRRLSRADPRIERPVFLCDAEGHGRAVYVLGIGGRSYALVAVSGGTGIGVALHDGVPEAQTLARLFEDLGKEGPIRVSAREICVARLQRDDVIWPQVVAALAQGAQPAPLTEDGVLLWSGTVLASGKAGTTDRELIEDRPELHAPYQAELLMLWLARILARDLCEAMARAQGGERAVALEESRARSLGVGLWAGLGMAAFAVNHPCLFNTWMMAREEALGRVRGLDRATEAEWREVAAGVAAMACEGQAALLARMAEGPAAQAPWAKLAAWAEAALPVAAQEALASAMLEPHGLLIDGLGHCMSDRLDRDFRIDGAMAVGHVRALIAGVHGWALERDWSEVSMTALAWSMTGEEQDPRLGARQGGPGGMFELPLAIVHDAVRAWRAMGLYPDETPVAQVLLDHPDHRGAIRRAQIAAFAPYAEIRENLIDADLRPDLLIRAMLSFLGAELRGQAQGERIAARIFGGAPCPVARDGAPCSAARDGAPCSVARDGAP